MEIVHNLQFESLYDSLKAIIRAMAMIYSQVTNIDKIHRKKPSTNGRTLGLVDDDYLSKVENQEWLNDEGLQDNTCDSSPFEIKIILLSLFTKDDIYDDLMWPKPPWPPLVLFIQAHQAHEMELSQVEYTCQMLPHITKLEGVQKQSPYYLILTI
ncbi:hypothetical protein PanWU01x14_339220 [Parasponia andersonii]|uniref:Uncharacterized protein n=1 Tax=Parasponia andersonii TaxID=3476 RepID=A0A2P5AEW5_PARAD|nr:hypothetical protein PanWU01x14_339220 [Parasponia andersonii]